MEEETTKLQRAQLQYPLDPESEGALVDSLERIIKDVPLRQNRVQFTIPAGATSFSVASNYMVLTGAAGVTIAKIMDGREGSTLILQFTDANVIITDTGTSAADTVNLNSAFTSAANVILALQHDGTSWREVARSTTGGVTSVTATAPVVSSGGTTPNISLNELYTVNADETSNTWFTWTESIQDATWTKVVGATITGGGSGYTSVSILGGTQVSSLIPGNGSNSNYTPASSKDLRIKWRAILTSVDGTQYGGLGIVNAATDVDASRTSTAVSSVRFVIDASTIYAVTSDGANNENTDISSGVTITNWNIYEIVLNPGVNAKFYINGTLKATHTVLPTTTLPRFAMGIDGGAGKTWEFSPLIFSIEQ